MSFLKKGLKADPCQKSGPNLFHNLVPSSELDHRELNQNHHYYYLSDKVGPGLPLWQPAGGVIRDELEKWMRELEFAAGYERVLTPSLAKEELYFQSGHLPYFEDSMYPAIEVDQIKYRLRPMCCPHHHLLFASRPRSYRELPIRLAEFGQIFRFENSGSLSGLMRVRGICQNDAHIYCLAEQVRVELRSVLKIYLEAFGHLGLYDYRLRLSKWDPDDKNQKYAPLPLEWEKHEAILREILVEMNLPFSEAVGEAAFYGPKIDVQLKSKAQREETASTVQLDFYSSVNFDLSFINKHGQPERPLIIHRAPLGSLERMVALLIEKHQGRFPVWLSSVQVQVLPVGESHFAYANELRALLCRHGLRCAVDARVEPLKRKLADAYLQNAPYIVVIGDREIKEGILAVQRRFSQVQTEIGQNRAMKLAMSAEQLLQRVLEEKLLRKDCFRS